MQTETKTTTEASPAADLITVAQSIHAWQNEQSPKISDEGMLKRFPALGSVKTYRRLRDGDTTQLHLEDGEWLKDYQAVKALCDVAALGQGDDPIYSDLTPTKEVAERIAELCRGRGLDRILIVQGGTGSGKTKALECAHALIANSVLVTADIMWTLSNSAFLGDLVKSLGGVRERDAEEFDRKTSCAYRAALLKRTLGQRRLVILLDEAHHLSADGIDFIKGLVNNFRNLYFVLAGMDTLWTRLTADRWQQAKQIIYNRGLATVHLSPPTAEDALTFLTRRAPGFDVAPHDAALAELVADARQFGSFAYLRRVARKLGRVKGELDADALQNANRLAKKDLRTSRGGAAA